jgi:hypothetical protein
VGFLVSWTPYAAVSMYRAFINGSELDPMTATIPAFFGKFSLAWPALLTLFGNKDIRNKLNFHNERHRNRNRKSLVFI